MSLEILYEHENLTKQLNSLKLKDFHEEVLNHGIALNSAYFTINGRLLHPQNLEDLPNGSKVRVKLRLLGGKGGFGSMLRAIGAQIEKTTNREACRDLSGRRLRDINEEKRLKAWLEKQKIEPENPDEKFKKKISKLLAKPKHEFKDDTYMKERTDLTERVDEAVEQGFKRAQEIESNRGVKRANVDIKGCPKKTKGAVWTGLEDGSSGEDSGGSDSNLEEEDFSADDPTMAKIIELYIKDREKDVTIETKKENDNGQASSSESKDS